jgi:hypothetical protein
LATGRIQDGGNFESGGHVFAHALFSDALTIAVALGACFTIRYLAAR